MTNYRMTSARLARIVSTLAEDAAALAEMVNELTLADRPVAGGEAPDPNRPRKISIPYPAELTKYDDRPLYNPTPAGQITVCSADAGDGPCGYPFDEDGWCTATNRHPRLIARAPLPDEPVPAKPTYSIPHPPPQEYRVIDTNGRRWTHSTTAHGMFDRLGIDPGDALDVPTIPLTLSWPDLLASYGPVTLDEWTAEETAGFELYGPPGARWGDPQQECPHYACAMGLHHTPPHRDVNGDPIGETEADGSFINASITPHKSSENPCTCGNPAAHQPDCARYARVAGVATDEESPSLPYLTAPCGQPYPCEHAPDGGNHPMIPEGDR